MLRAGLLLIPTLTLLSSAALAQPAPAGRLFDVAPEAPAPTPPIPGPARVTARLEYTRGPGAEACPDEPGLRGAVAAVMGYDPFAPDAGPLVRVWFARRGAAFVAVMDHRDAAGRSGWSRKPLADGDCQRLASVTALLIVSAIDPARAAAAPAPPAPPTLVIVPPVEQAPPRDEVPPAVSTRPRVRLGARAGVAIGTLPAPAATIAADVGARWEHFSISAEGRADLPVTTTAEAGVRLRASALAGSIVPCGHYRWFAGCAVVSVGALQAEGVEMPRAAGGSGVYAAAGLRAGFEWPIPKVEILTLRLSAEALATLHPIVLARADGSEAWRTPPFAGLFGGGLVMVF